MKYWEQEQPIIVDTGRNVLRFFKEAGKLQISHPNWTDDKGQERQGKTVTLDVGAVQETPEAAEIIQQIIA